MTTPTLQAASYTLRGRRDVNLYVNYFRVKLFNKLIGKTFPQIISH